MSDAIERARDLFFAGLDHHNHYRYPQAEALYRQAMALVPDRVSILVNLGAVLIAQEKFAEAHALSRHVLSIEPDNSIALEHCSTCSAAIDPAGRIAHIDRQLAVQPANATLLSQRGMLLHEAGRRDEALDSLNTALAVDPSDVAAYMNRAAVLTALSRHDAAIDDYITVLRLAPDLAAAGHGFIDRILESHSPPRVDHEFDSLLIRAIETPWARPQAIEPVVIARLRQDPLIGPLLQRNTPVSKATASPDVTPILEMLARNQLLSSLLRNALVATIELERLLTRCRSELLHRIIDAPDVGRLDRDLLGFVCALAQQCFINEYVYPVSPEDRQGVDRLVARLTTFPLVPERDGAAIAAVASYLPLHMIGPGVTWLDHAWPDGLQALMRQQIREPMRERESRPSIVALTAIDDETSMKVRDQYEANPYPRWTSLPDLGVREPLEALLRRKVVSPSPIQLRPANPVRALNAGCGTGQHPIDMALRVADLDLLAIDLSLSSLAYARRKADDMAIGANLRFAQADILQMATYPERFDLIESTGVLHHLDDPAAGLAVLTGLLADGGIMRIALYSDTGRRDVVASRSYIAAKGYAAVDDDIRQCRQELMDLPDNDPRKPVTRLTDFYAMSGCRDLLFHVQEHRFSMTMIADLLAAHRLDLIGIEVTPHTLAAFRDSFPDATATLDLHKWDRFERAHPDTFSGMYVFWVRKALPPGALTASV